MDFYKEYNRVRKNMMARARRRGISLVNIPTAKQLSASLNKTIGKAELNKIKKRSKTLDKLIIKSTKSRRLPSTYDTPSQTSRRHYGAPSPSSIKRHKSTTTPPETIEQYKEVYDKYGTDFLSQTIEGRIIDKITGDDIASSLDATPEELGKHIVDNYYDSESDDIKLPSSYSSDNVYELQMFFAFIQDRVNSAFNDYLSRSRSDVSLQGISLMQELLSTTKTEDLATALARYEMCSDEIKTYLDDVLHYTPISDDHYRAMEIVADLFTQPYQADLLKQTLAAHSEDSSFFEDLDDESPFKG